MVVPNRMQASDAFGPGSPDSVATGTSTGGVRIPPRAIPSASRTITGGVSAVNSIRGASTGAAPVSIHVTSARNPALATTSSGPLLIG